MIEWGVCLCNASGWQDKTATKMKKETIYENDDVIINVEYPEKEEKKATQSSWLLVLPVFMFAFIISIVFLLIDTTALHNAYENKLFLPKCDCKEKLPKTVSIVYNGSYYAVKRQHEKYGEQYLWSGSHGFDWMYPSIAKGDYFLDTCNAKAALFYNKKIHRNKMKDFR